MVTIEPRIGRFGCCLGKGSDMYNNNQNETYNRGRSGQGGDRFNQGQGHYIPPLLEVGTEPGYMNTRRGMPYNCSRGGDHGSQSRGMHHRNSHGNFNNPQRGAHNFPEYNGQAVYSDEEDTFSETGSVRSCGGPVVKRESHFHRGQGNNAPAAFVSNFGKNQSGFQEGFKARGSNPNLAAAASGRGGGRPNRGGRRNYRPRGDNGGCGNYHTTVDNRETGFSDTASNFDDNDDNRSEAGTNRGEGNFKRPYHRGRGSCHNAGKKKDCVYSNQPPFQNTGHGTETEAVVTQVGGRGSCHNAGWNVERSNADVGNNFLDIDDSHSEAGSTSGRARGRSPRWCNRGKNRNSSAPNGNNLATDQTVDGSYHDFNFAVGPEVENAMDGEHVSRGGHSGSGPNKKRGKRGKKKDCVYSNQPPFQNTGHDDPYDALFQRQDSTSHDSGSHFPDADGGTERMTVHDDKVIDAAAVVKYMITEHHGSCRLDVLKDELCFFFDNLFKKEETLNDIIDSLRKCQFIKIKTSETDLSKSTVKVIVNVNLCTSYSTKTGCRKLKCHHLHICRNYVARCCQFINNCIYDHSFTSRHNAAIMKGRHLDAYNESEQIDLIRCASLMACTAYVTSEGCPEDESCCSLHTCNDHILNKCLLAERCPYGHDIKTGHNASVLRLHFQNPEKMSEEFLFKLVLVNKVSKPNSRNLPWKSNALSLNDKGFLADDIANCSGVAFNDFAAAQENIVAQHAAFNDQSVRSRNAQLKDGIKHRSTDGGRNEIISAEKFAEKLTLQDGYSVKHLITETTDGKDVARSKIVGLDEIQRKNVLKIHSDASKMSSSSTLECDHHSASRSEEAGIPSVTPRTRASNPSGENIVSVSSDFSKCDSFEHHECSEGEFCVKRHGNKPYLWMIKRNNVWISLDALNSAIERQFCNPKTESVSCPCRQDESNIRLNFLSMTFKTTISLPSGKYPVGQLQRLSSPSYVNMDCRDKTDVTHWRWYYYDENRAGGWHLYGEGNEVTHQDVLESKYLQNPNQMCCFEIGNFQYELDFSKMYQTNLSTGVVRMIRRRPLFVESDPPTNIIFHFDPRKLPQGNYNWSPMDTESPLGTELVPLLPDTAQYEEVFGMFHSTRARIKFKIKHIYRLQNVDLWNAYHMKKQKMERQKKPGHLPERFLFHGTADLSTVREICAQGFDQRMHGVNGTMYGKGAYFATTAKYSHAYTKPSPNKPLLYMFYARVMIGACAQGDSELKRPPPLNVSQPKLGLYDTCVDDLSNPSIFVIFENSQSYPEYLIAYESLDDLLPRPAPLHGIFRSTTSLSSTGISSSGSPASASAAGAAAATRATSSTSGYSTQSASAYSPYTSTPYSTVSPTTTHSTPYSYSVNTNNSASTYTPASSGASAQFSSSSSQTPRASASSSSSTAAPSASGSQSPRANQQADNKGGCAVM